MVRICAVRNCKRKRGPDNPDLKFYSFPVLEPFRAEWVKFCDARKVVPKNGAICSAHFEASNKATNALQQKLWSSPKSKRNLSVDAVPTLYGPETTAAKASRIQKCSTDEAEKSSEQSVRTDSQIFSDSDERTASSSPAIKILHNRWNVITETEYATTVPDVEESIEKSITADGQIGVDLYEPARLNTSGDMECASTLLDLLFGDECGSPTPVAESFTVIADQPASSHPMETSLLVSDEGSFLPDMEYATTMLELSRGEMPAVENSLILEMEQTLEENSRILQSLNSVNEALTVNSSGTFVSHVAVQTDSDDLNRRLTNIISDNEKMLQCGFNLEVENERQQEWLLQKQHYQELLSQNEQLKKSEKILQAERDSLSTDLGKFENRVTDLLQDNKVMSTALQRLKRQNSDLQAENKRLKAELASEKEISQKYENILKKFFTPGQLRRLLLDTKNDRLRWSPEDIASAISLRCASIKGYRYLKYKRNHPLPHPRTLRRWAQKVSIQEGVMESVLSLMHHKGQSMTELQRLTVLSYDEMSCDSLFCYDRGTDTVYGENTKIQVVMARGLCGKWKQPIAFFFDTDMTKSLLFEILEKLHKINYNVVAVVSDLGGENRSFLKELNITNEYVSFKHPSSTEKNEMLVFCFADAPHLIKLGRNHFLDEGYTYNGTEIRKDVIEKILAAAVTEVNIAHKLSQSRHLDVFDKARQRVGPAAELMSKTTANLIDHCAKKGYIKVRNSKIVSKVIRAFGVFFDSFNNTDKQNTLYGKEAYGLSLESQNKELTDVYNTLRTVKQIKILKNGQNTKALLPFQHGIMRNIKALQEMFLHCKERYGLKYILTRRLNQDVLENFFGYIRGMGGRCDHPSPVDFKYRMKLYILGKDHAAVMTVNRNTKEQVDEECLVTPTKSFERNVNVTPTKPVSSKASNVRNTALEDQQYLDEDADYFENIDLLVDHFNKVTEEDEPESIEQQDKDHKLSEERDAEGLEIEKDDSSAENDMTADAIGVKEVWKTLNKGKETAEEMWERQRAEDDESDFDEEETDTAESDADDEEEEVEEKSSQIRKQRKVEPKAADKSAKEVENELEELWKVLNEDAATVAEKLEEEGFEYLAGYVAHRFRTKYTFLGKKTSECIVQDDDWIKLVSKGHLIRPSSQFIQILKCVEATFLQYHGNDKTHMRKGSNCISNVLQQAKSMLAKKFSPEVIQQYPDEVVKCFIRVRTFIRIRGCNERLHLKNLAKRNAKKFNNKMNKLTN